MLLQSFLRQNGIEAITLPPYNVKIKRHGIFNNLVLFKYDQIESPMGDPMVQTCRGIILDEANDWAVVCRPYDKFFNAGEGHAAQINWSYAKCFEKLDGSLMNIYYYHGEWHVSSSGMPDAAGPVNLGTTTFRELFWNLWKQLGYRMPINTDLTYCFELMTPQNRVIVPIEKSRIVLHGIRCKHTGMEFDIDPTADHFGWEKAKCFPLNSITAIVEAANALNPMESEGYVVVDNLFRRIKVKSPQYVALAHIKDSMSERRMVEIVRSNEFSEFLVYFKEYKPLYDAIKNNYDKLVNDLESAWEQNQNIPVQKDFAMAIKDRDFSSVLFGMRNNKFNSVKDGLVNTNIKYLTEYLTDGLDIGSLFNSELINA